jgi:hypothetical protein
VERETLKYRAVPCSEHESICRGDGPAVIASNHVTSGEEGADEASDSGIPRFLGIPRTATARGGMRPRGAGRRQRLNITSIYGSCLVERLVERLVDGL